MKLTQAGAQAIINKVASGEPPDYNHYYYSSGLEPLLTSLAREYLSDYLLSGGTAFKLLVGPTGSGKTHLCYALRDLAWQHNYAVAYLPVSATGAAFADLASVYQQISQLLMVPPYGYRRAATTGPLAPEPLLHAPLAEERGLASVLQGWYARSYLAACGKLLTSASSQAADPIAIDPAAIDAERIDAELKAYLAQVTSSLETDNNNLTRALLTAFEALAAAQPKVFEAMLTWLYGQGFNKVLHKKRHGILEPVSARNALSLICGLSQWLRFIGYGGLVILLDVQQAAPERASKSQVAHLVNLLSVVNDTANQRMSHVMWVYATHDTAFLEGGARVHKALQQRLTSVFDSDLNPSGVHLDLNSLLPLSRDHLEDVGYKLAYLHEVAYRQAFEDEPALEACINLVIDHTLTAAGNTTNITTSTTTSTTTEAARAGSRRQFIQLLSEALKVLRLEGRSMSQSDLANLAEGYRERA
ncbi:MAG: BREX system ATP-binding domain-containing protein [Deinococcota bacterium]